MKYSFIQNFIIIILHHVFDWTLYYTSIKGILHVNAFIREWQTWDINQTELRCNNNLVKKTPENISKN